MCLSLAQQNSGYNVELSAGRTRGGIKPIAAVRNLDNSVHSTVYARFVLYYWVYGSKQNWLATGGYWKGYIGAS